MSTICRGIRLILGRLLAQLENSRGTKLGIGKELFSGARGPWFEDEATPLECLLCRTGGRQWGRLSLVGDRVDKDPTLRFQKQNLDFGVGPGRSVPLFGFAQTGEPALM